MKKGMTLLGLMVMAATAADAGVWRTAKGKDRLTGEPFALTGTQSIGDARVVGGGRWDDSACATLFVDLIGGGVFIQSPTYLSRGPIRGSWAFDGGEVQTGTMDASEQVAVFPDPAAFLADLKAAKHLVVRVWDFRDRTHTWTFDVSKLPESR